MLEDFFDIKLVPLPCTITEKMHRMLKKVVFGLFLWSTVYVTRQCHLLVPTDPHIMCKRKAGSITSGYLVKTGKDRVSWTSRCVTSKPWLVCYDSRTTPVPYLVNARSAGTIRCVTTHGKSRHFLHKHGY